MLDDFLGLFICKKCPGGFLSGVMIAIYDSVLGSATTGLIFTGIKEGAQPGGLTQPGQTEPGIPYHVPSCWVPVTGKLGGRNSLTAPECTAVEAALGVVWFVLCILLTRVIVVTIPLVCCSVKLPLSRPTSFCLFLSILLRTLVGRGEASWRFCYQLQSNHNR